MGRTAASYLFAGWFHGHSTLMISSKPAHLSDTGLLQIVRAVVAAPLAFKMYSLDFSQEPTNMPDSFLSSAFVRSVNGPTRYHTRSPNASAHVVSADLTTIRTIPFHRTQPCPSSASWWPAQCLRFWWYLHLASELKSVLACPDHATHQSHCSLGQSISSVIAPRRCFPSGYGSCPSGISCSCGDPQLVLHRYVWSPASSLARPPTLPASRLHAGPLLPFSQWGGGEVECKDHIPVRRSLATNIGVAPAWIATVNAHKLTLIIVPWMLLMSTFKTSQPHNACTNP